jgi:hypothetical protein
MCAHIILLPKLAFSQAIIMQQFKKKKQSITKKKTPKIKISYYKNEQKPDPSQ